VVGGGGFEPP